MIYKKLKKYLGIVFSVLIFTGIFASPDINASVKSQKISKDLYSDKMLFEEENINAENVQNQRKKTLKNFLKTALMPVGKTMYVWGGGWNKEDTGAGIEAVSIGLSPNWEKFAKKQNKNYNYKKTSYQIHDGLDCSGYVGWVIYNVFHDKDGQKGYVMLAEKMAKEFSKQGFGTFTPAKSVKNYRAGDIMSNKYHVYIVIGTCSDGSVVLVHASPPGVQINGTVNSKGQKNSEAKKLADSYMKKYFHSWYAKYPPKTLELSYLKKYDQMRWNIGKNGVIQDEEGLADMNASQVLKVIFDE
ncbi:hypothetical protein HMPREF0379_0094 [[Eubacterium] yurii subsp. margaretiae ATCC 43715]|nr:hypothetical protein HMPREF0379_0094 [[Eubacterium] yurii subsp. margaretiae ATCC 43715]